MIEITKSNFQSKLGNTSALLLFGADWCVPCRQMTPIIEGLSKKYSGKIVFGHVDIDKEPELASMYDIMSVPTFIFYLGGVAVNSLIGAVPEHKLQALIGKP